MIERTNGKRRALWWDANTLNIMNPRTGAIWTDQEVRDALIGVYTHLRSKMPNLIIAANGTVEIDGKKEKMGMNTS